MVKYFSFFLASLFFSLFCYWNGVQIGLERAAAQKLSLEASYQIDAINQLKQKPDVNVVDLHEARINALLIEYGKYLESKRAIAPGLENVDKATQVLFSQVARYRNGNPRLINGIKYAPFNVNYLSSESYNGLSESQKLKIDLDASYYNKAINTLLEK
ncbi:hypothetical protein [Agarilytica rhodophyticola]|uniref:hypothetical protein n=1 Tax=Agarilytica rhodophyticola TaxID=1737490 RepID=UPI000B348957|nr:hypothetical protein [Agarilytica rhodophyticola]